MQTVDSIDEPTATPMPEKELVAQQKATQDQFVQQPDPQFHANPNEPQPKSRAFNTMAEQLERGVREVTNPPRPKAEPEPKLEPKPEVKAEPKVDDESKNFTSAKAKDWKELKDKIAEHKAKREEFEKKYAEKEKAYLDLEAKWKIDDKTPELTKQIDEIKAHRDRLQSQIEKIDLAQSEPFVAHYNKKFESAINRAKEAVGEDSERAISLLQMPPSKWRKAQLNDVREKLEGVDQGQLDIAIADYDRARSEREAELANHKESFARAQEVMSARRMRELELSNARLAETAQRILQTARQYESFKPNDNADHNAFVKANEESILKFLKGEMNPDEAAVMPVLAAEARYMNSKIIPALRNEVEELKAALSAHSAAKPKVDGGKQSAPGDAEKRKTFTERVLEELGQ